MLQRIHNFQVLSVAEVVVSDDIANLSLRLGGILAPLCEM